MVCWVSQLRAAHPAQQKLRLQAEDVAGFFFGLKPKNLIDTGVYLLAKESYSLVITLYRFTEGPLRNPRWKKACEEVSSWTSLPASTSLVILYMLAEEDSSSAGSYTV
ncbi:hypothetical protein PGT21_019429 [Puccinia graminis f. sp. tritici]|uniref:Uncharacterized protein n=1 Tax=Puccinia graminis f. sp. tritici TaxID=56615 RepID=A0A5B0MF11_PUCGR|nr:hypothetical protein PGT21_019429 [Puccinia graminis f. sp. tritici]